MSVRFYDVTTVDTSHGRSQPELLGNMTGSRVHAPGAQAYGDAFRQQLSDRFSIPRVNLPIRVEQRSVEIRN